jgi:hypothetical protein
MNAERVAFTDALRAALPADVTVYPMPPDTLAVPAVVVLPGNPYLKRGTSCLYEMKLDIAMFVARSDERAAYDAIDALTSALIEAIKTINNAALDAVNAIGPTEEVQGVSYLSGTASVTLLTF